MARVDSGQTGHFTSTTPFRRNRCERATRSEFRPWCAVAILVVRSEPIDGTARSGRPTMQRPAPCEERRMAQWRKKTADEVYSTDEIEARLKDELPHWYLEDGWIRRKFKTSGWKSTLMVVNTVGHLAEAAWHHPDLTVSYAFVTV